MEEDEIPSEKDDEKEAPTTQKFVIMKGLTHESRIDPINFQAKIPEPNF